MNKIMQITKNSKNYYWNAISNPDWESPQSLGAMMILGNPFNEYVEYQNCGCVIRYIRKKDKKKYIPDCAKDTEIAN